MCNEDEKRERCGSYCGIDEVVVVGLERETKGENFEDN